MTRRFIKRVTAARCPIHQACKEQALMYLEKKGYFRKEKVLEDTNYTVASELIRWDYIAGFIEDEFGLDLVPVAGRFFKAVDKAKEGTLWPTRLLASGHGKRTEGYCSAEFNGGTFAAAKLNRKLKQAQGLKLAYDNEKTRIEKKHPEIALDSKMDEVKLLDNKGKMLKKNEN